MASIKTGTLGSGEGARPKRSHMIESGPKIKFWNRKSQDSSKWRRQDTLSRGRHKSHPASIPVDSEDLKDDDSNFLLECAGQNVLLEGLIIYAARTHNIGSVLRRKDKHDFVAIAKFADVDGDVFVLLNAMRAWVNELRATNGDITAWLCDNSLDGKLLATIEEEVQRSYNLLKERSSNLPDLNFRANLVTMKNSLIDILLRNFAKNMCAYMGHDIIGYRKLSTGTLVRATETSVLRFYAKSPQYVVPLLETTEPNVINEKNEVFSHPKVSVEASLLFVVPLQLAPDVLLDTMDKASNDRPEQEFLQRMEINYIGHVTTGRLVKSWGSRKSDSLSNKALQICGKASCLVVEVHPISDSLRVFCRASHHADIRALLEAEIAAIRQTLASETVQLPYPDTFSQLSISVSSGIQCQTFLFPGESQSAVIKAIAGVEITWAGVLSILKNFTGIKSLWTPDPADDSEDDILGYISTTSLDTLRTLLEESRKRSFPFYIRESIPNDTLEHPLCHFSDNLFLTLTWRVHTDRYSKPRVTDGDEAMVRATICRVLDDLSEDKVTVNVIAGPEDKKRGLVRAHVSFADHTTAHRGVEMLKEFASGGLPVQIDNQNEVDTRLKSLTVYFKPRLYLVIQSTVIARLENFRLSDKYRAAYELKVSENGRVGLKVTGYTQQACVEMRVRLKETVAAVILKVSRVNAQRMMSRSGDAFRRLVERQTNTCITVSALSNKLLIYGNRVNKTNAVEQLQNKLSGNDQPAFLIDPKGDGLPNDFLLTMGTKLQCQYLGPNETYFQPSLVYKTRGKAIEGLIDTHMKEPDQTCDIYQPSNPPADCTCVSCFVDISLDDDSYVLEGCGHVYCLECLKMQIEEAVNNTSFPVLCAHDNQPMCAFDILNIVTRLRLVSFKRILSALVRDFVGRNPDTYRFCSRLNCPGVCRRHQTQLVDCLACCFCNKKLCPKCLNSYHKFLTCEQAAADTFKLNEWINEEPKRRKKCPSCKIGIEKIDGCNRITCASCNQSICWVCMEFFKTPQECYDHLTKKHGGYGF